MSMFPILGTNLCYLQLYSVFFKDFLQALQILKQCFKPRYSTTDHWIQESIKWIINSGLFLGSQGCREKKKNQSAISMQLLRSVFFMFSLTKNLFSFLKKNIVVSTLKSYIAYIKVRKKNYGKVEGRG